MRRTMAAGTDPTLEASCAKASQQARGASGSLPPGWAPERGPRGAMWTPGTARTGGRHGTHGGAAGARPRGAQRVTPAGCDRDVPLATPGTAPGPGFRSAGSTWRRPRRRVPLSAARGRRAQARGSRARAAAARLQAARGRCGAAGPARAVRAHDRRSLLSTALPVWRGERLRRWRRP